MRVPSAPPTNTPLQTPVVALVANMAQHTGLTLGEVSAHTKMIALSSPPGFEGCLGLWRRSRNKFECMGGMRLPCCRLCRWRCCSTGLVMPSGLTCTPYPFEPI